MKKVVGFPVAGNCGRKLKLKKKANDISALLSTPKENKSKESITRFVHLEKFSLDFSSSSFVICVNLLHP